MNIVDDYLAGVGINKLGRMYGVGSWQVQKILKEHKVVVRQPTSRTVLDSQLLQLAKKHCDAEIARIVGLSKVTVSKRLRKLGICSKLTTDTNRKYPICFDDLIKLDKEIGAYWFGFLLADGNISKIRQRLTCNLQYGDYNHLVTLCRDLRTPNFPKKRTVTIRGKQKSRASLVINSQKLCGFYRDSGWTQFKSGVIDIPQDTNIRHLLRGLWDGDGIVTSQPNRKSTRLLRMGFVSPHCDIVEWITSLLPIDYTPQKINIHNNCFYRFWGHHASIAIARWLYTNQSRALSRKVAKISTYF